MKTKAILNIAVAGFILMIVSCQHHPIVPYVPGSCDPDSVYFNKDVFPIIQSNCNMAGCHGNGSAQEGVDLTSYDGIMLTGEIKPFDPNGSDLFEAITETDVEDRMPLAPANALTADQIDKIRRWIEQGAKNNFCSDCDTNLITFSGAVFPTVQSNCKGCHSGAAPSGGISLTNYSEIKSQAESGALYGVVNHEVGFVPMPFGQAKLDDCKIVQIKKWIEAGALDN